MTRIAGLFSLTPLAEDTAIVRRMLDTFVRANNETQIVTAVAGSTVMGAIRSVFTPAAMISRGKWTAVLDGHVYAAEDMVLGSQASVEVFLDLCMRFGFTGALKRINGDFAVAAYHGPSGELFAARDRFGLKPLYYCRTADRLAFASQPRALLTLPGVRRELNRQFVALYAASHYRTFDNDPHASPYADISQLPAGHMLRVAPDLNCHLERYWTLEAQEDWALPEAELAEAYKELLLDAVRIRLRVARKPAFTLSGGMDSSTILACAVHVTGEKQHAFSSVYEDKTFDESEDIKPMLETKVAQWYPVRIGTPDVFDLVQKMVRIHDEPVATATWLSHYLLCEEAANLGFGSLFGGLGGDELNAGEYEYFIYHFADLRVAGEHDRLNREIECWARNHDHPVYRKNPDVAEEALQRLVDLSIPGLCRADRKRIERYKAILNPEYFDLKTFDPIMDHPFSSYLKNRTYQDIFRETAPCCLRAEDRHTFAFGLERFDPFFDHRLVEFMFRVPGTMKIREGVTKVLLRKATRELLPEETRTRIKKTGWNAPAHVWFSSDILNTLLPAFEKACIFGKGRFNIPEIRRLIDEHLFIVDNGPERENHMMLLWQLINIAHPQNIIGDERPLWEITTCNGWKSDN